MRSINLGCDVMCKSNVNKWLLYALIISSRAYVLATLGQIRPYGLDVTKLAMEGSTLIPQGLSPSESGVYEKLIQVAQQRKERRKSPRPVVVITDLGEDYDDLTALTVLKELHRLGLIQLRAVVANLVPADKRARLARAVLDSLRLQDVAVARGTRGSLDEHGVSEYEFSWGEFVSAVDVDVDVPELDGKDLLRKVY